jgi:hypothetical protein
MPWKTFLKAHWGAIAAADFFSVEVLTVGGFVRYLVLFVIELKTRRVHVAGITCQADGEWMAQIARNLTDAIAGPLRGSHYLIIDRDPLYTAHFKRLMDSAGVKLFATAGSESEFERVRGTIRSFDQARMPASHCSAGRGSSAPHGRGVRRALSLRTQSPRPRQCHSLSHSSARRRAWSHPPPRTPWRTTQLLRTIRRVNCDPVSGQNAVRVTKQIPTGTLRSCRHASMP